MMTFLCAVLGLWTGGLLNWSSDYLPRFATVRVEPAPRPAARPSLAIWQFVRPLLDPEHRLQPTRAETRPWFGLAVEAGLAALFTYLWLRYGPTWKMLYLAVACAFFALVTLIDLKYRLVLNVLVYPAALLALLLHALPPGQETLWALLGGAVGASPFLLAALLKPEGMGWGDVRLGLVIGLLVSFPYVLWALSLGIMAGTLVALVLIVARRGSLASQMPYAPFLCLGAVLSLLGVPFFFVLHV